MLKESIITEQQKNVPEVFNTESILQYTLSLHDALKELKKRSILNREQDGHGFVSPTDIEREVLFDCKKKMGRAKKQKIDSHNI